MQLLAVNFHYIREEKPPQGIYPRSIQEFSDQLTEIGQYFDFLSLAELCQMQEENSYPEGKYCIITFDDNLKEQIRAYSYLEDNNIPAAFFSTTLPYIESKVHDVHKLHYIYSVYSDAEIALILQEMFCFDDFIFDESLLAKEYRYDTLLKKKIKFFLNFHLPPQQREQVIECLFSQSIISHESFIAELYMGLDDLCLLAEKKMLGSHTHSHHALSTLMAREIKNEIFKANDFLFGLTGKKIEAISYPFGGPGAVNKGVVKIVEQYGYKIGFTMNRGLNSQADFSEPLLLQRVDTNDAPGGKLASKEYCL
jgi:peptidoglycan/xylan/chitin deacetylase (PgdA/CDA1 family)